MHTGSGGKNNVERFEFKEDQLESVLSSLATIKQTATQMAMEVKEHNSLLTDLESDVNHAGSRLDNANRNIGWIAENGSARESWMLTITAVILFIILIILILA